MNLQFSQASRLGRLTTALGPDALILLKFSGMDRVNDLFEFTVEALSTRPDFDPDGIIGTPATVQIATQAHGPRFFNGIVTEVASRGFDQHGEKFVLTLRPWLWLAGRRHNMRIFHNQTVVEIVQNVLRPYAGLGSPALQTALAEDYPTLEYTVQFRESDMDFARRQLERFGISFHFTQSADGHTMVLTDLVENHPQVAGAARPFIPYESDRKTGAEHFWKWNAERHLTTGATQLVDYNFKKPLSVMKVKKTGDATYMHGQIEAFDFPGDYTDEGQGKRMAHLRTVQARGQDHRVHALGDCLSLGSGMRMTLAGADGAGRSGTEYLCLSARHSFTAEAYASTSAATSESAYEGAYVLMPAAAPFAPRRKTAVPSVLGPQTAVVVGEGEIDCDAYGRILVQFHWDVANAYSMRCRVSQSWASKGWGGMVIPRIGMEVVVEFLDGDPDKPLVTGCVYNGRNQPPADLPANKTRSVFKTNSHGGEGFNELTFEDESGKEFIYLHAQRNLDQHVRNSSQKRVEFDDNTSVGNNYTLAVAANRTETVDGNQGVTIKGDFSEKTDGQRGISVGGSFSTNAKGDLTFKASGEIVLDASKITLVSGGAAVVVQGGAVHVAPVLNVGSASPGAAAIPAIPAILKAAAGEGMPFVSHCPMDDV
ncbi:MAG: type secretion system tip protein VgrG [Pseudomonadota bacterium]|jgi:type VI secretion system secreted protein VgrG